MNEQYCLRWNDHRSTLLHNFERLLENASSVDCTLAAEGQCVRAHKIVLSACSPYFEMLLNQDKDKHAIIFMKDVKFKELQAIILYMYRGEVVIPHDQLTALLQAAESLQIKGLGCGDKHTDNANKNISFHETQLQQPVQRKSFKQPQPQHHPPMQIPPQTQLQPQLHVQHPSQIAVQNPPVLQCPPSVRKIAASKVIESPPQIVDLTDDRPSPQLTSISHQGFDNVKQSVPPTLERQKRASYSTSVGQNVPGSTVTHIQAVTQNTVQTQNVAPTFSVNQANTGRTSFSLQNRVPSNSSGGSNIQQINTVLKSTSEVLGRPQVVQQTEKQKGAESQSVVYKINPKTNLTRISNNITQMSQFQSSSGQESNSSNVQNQKQAVSSEGSTNEIQESDSNIVNATHPPGAKKGKRVENAPTFSKNSLPETVEESFQQEDKDKNLVLQNEGENIELHEMSVNDLQNNQSESTDNVEKPGPSNVKNSGPKPGRGRGRRKASERPFACPECSKKFSHKGFLEKHLRLHGGDCFQCNACEKSFLSRGTLIKHLHTHNQKPSTTTDQNCQLCGASFPTKDELECHLTEHTMSVEEDKE